MILIIIIIIKITSPTDASSEFHFTEVKMQKKKKTGKKGLRQRCELSSGLDCAMMEGRRYRCGRKDGEVGGLHLFSHQYWAGPEVWPVFGPLSAVNTTPTPPPPHPHLRVQLGVSDPGTSCSTSVGSRHGCRTWTWVPAGSRPLCLRLCILEMRKETDETFLNSFWKSRCQFSVAILKISRLAFLSLFIYLFIYF